MDQQNETLKEHSSLVKQQNETLEKHSVLYRLQFGVMLFGTVLAALGAVRVIDQVETMQNQLDQYRWSTSYSNLGHIEDAFKDSLNDKTVALATLALHGITEQELKHLDVSGSELAHVLQAARTLMETVRLSGKDRGLEESPYGKKLVEQEKAQLIYLVLLRKRLMFNTPIPDQIECHIRNNPASSKIKNILSVIDRKLTLEKRHPDLIQLSMDDLRLLDKETMAMTPMKCADWQNWVKLHKDLDLLFQAPSNESWLDNLKKQPEKLW